MQDYNQPAPAGATPPKKSRKVWVILVVILLVVGIGFVALLALGLGGYYYFSRSTPTASRARATGTGSGLTGSPSSPSTAADDGDVEGPEPTSAQAAAVAGGQAAEWEQQEISWTVPQRWTKHSASSTGLLWRSPGSWDAASLIGNISPMSADFPAEISLNQYYSSAQERKQRGEVSEVRWLRIDGVKGVMFREAAPESSDDPQRLQWIAFRNYKGQQQMLNIMLASRGKDFARHEDALYGILYSMKLTK